MSFYRFIAAGYLVHSDEVLLVRHKRLEAWVPPGGHVEPGETFSEALSREFHEETGLSIDVLSVAPVVHEPDGITRPEPVPFYIDVEDLDTTTPAVVHFYFVRAPGDLRVNPNMSEVTAGQFFNHDEVRTLDTFEQVRSLATYALRHHPDANP